MAFIPRSKSRVAFASIALMLSVIAPTTLALAQDDGATAAPAPTSPALADKFAVRRVWFDEKEGGYAVRADLQLGRADLLDGILRGGYGADMKFELRFVQRRDWRFDRVVGDIVWSNNLSYDAITRRYVLRRTDGSVLRFATLEGAAEKISRLRAGANYDREYLAILRRDDVYAQTRFYLERGKLPVPMQIELFFDFDDWDGGRNWRSLPLDLRHKP